MVIRPIKFTFCLVVPPDNVGAWLEFIAYMVYLHLVLREIFRLFVVSLEPIDCPFCPVRKLADIITVVARSMNSCLPTTCLSINHSVCPQGGYPGQVQMEGYPSQGAPYQRGPHLWYPPIGPGWEGDTLLGGYPTSGTPCWTWPGRYPAEGGYPTSGNIWST